MSEEQKITAADVGTVSVTALTTASLGALAVPDFLKSETDTGLDHYTKADIQMPRLALAQKLSPEIEEGNAAQIPGLKEGMMFNNLTREIYGKGPLEFMVIRGDRPRWVEFYPREQGGGVKDMNVPANDVRTQFIDGRPPAATQFYDFIIVLLPTREVIALSFKSTGLKIAKSLIALMKLREPKPHYAGKFTLSTMPTQNKNGKFQIFKVANSATVDEATARANGQPYPGWVSEELFHFGQQLYTSLKDKKVTIATEGERSEEADADTSFDTQKFADERM